MAWKLTPWCLQLGKLPTKLFFLQAISKPMYSVAVKAASPFMEMSQRCFRALENNIIFYPQTLFKTLSASWD